MKSTNATSLPFVTRKAGFYSGPAFFDPANLSAKYSIHPNDTLSVGGTFDRRAAAKTSRGFAIRLRSSSAHTRYQASSKRVYAYTHSHKCIQERVYSYSLIGHVAFRVQWPGVVVWVAMGGKDRDGGGVVDRYSYGGVVRLPRWRHRAGESANP